MARIYDLFPQLNGQAPDVRSRRYLVPTRVVWTSAADGADVEGAENLLKAKEEQVSYQFRDACVLRNHPGKPHAAVLLDYGIELHGSVRLWAYYANMPDDRHRCTVRISRGESAMEAMTPLDVKNTTNDHSNRDQCMNIGYWSGNETNESGFRFVRIELMDDDAELLLKSVNAVFIFRDIDYLGSFDCSDPLLTRIWQTAAYTAHLNMQEYLWDGIKRDRSVWIGDMHTEVLSILSAFGYNEVVPKSLDMARDDAPITDSEVQWMNNMPAYSLWWILIQSDWYLGTGDLDYLKQQKTYLQKLLRVLCDLVDADGVSHLPSEFLDWPDRADAIATHAGVQGLYAQALICGAGLLRALDDPSLAELCEKAAARMKKAPTPVNGSKPAASMLVLGGLADAQQMNRELLSADGAKGFSCFIGYYILKSKALAGDFDGALNALRQYWGGMLQMGATTFWEDFSLDWMENAAPIDDLVPEGKVDIHGDWGAYCYQQFRHSLCHGWSSGPCPYLTHYVLGVIPVEPGCRKLRIEPHLSDLSYVSGTYPTPYGVVTIHHRKMADGSVQTEIKAPKQIEIV